MLTKNRLIPLEKEIELVRTYLDIEKIRFEDRVRVKMEIDPASLQCRIPPLSIQTIAENAIKHGLSKLIDGGELIIKTEVNTDILMINISNTGHMSPDSSNHGIGIENVKRRLQLLYNNRFKLKINIFENKYIVKLKIPI